MRIKEEFKRLGDFWLPSAPDRKIPGTLSISEGGIIELEVAGLFNDEIEALLRDRLEPIERIAGDIEKEGLVTLDDCYYKTGTIRVIGGPSKSFIHVGRAFMGVEYNEGEPTVFNTLTFSVEGIDEWVGISGFEFVPQFEEHTATISYQLPTDVSLNLDNGMQLLITFEWTPPRLPIITEARISQKTNFKLVSKDARELSDFISVVHKITTFLCFSIDQTVILDSMKATSDDLYQDIGEGKTRTMPINIYYPSRPYSTDEPKIWQHDMLFGFGKIQNDAEEKINKWIKAYEPIDPAFDLYFSAKRGEQQYLDEKFLTLIRGLEAYHKRKFDGRLNIPLKQRIKGIIEPFKDIIGDESKRDSLIDKIVKTRNDLTHSNLDLNPQTAKSKILWYLCLKMELLFQLHFLHLIGFNREQIDSLLADSISLRQRSQLL